jgi:hypothetical protein
MIGDVAGKIEVVLERDVEQRDEVFCHGRRRIANFGNDRSDFE